MATALSHPTCQHLTTDQLTAFLERISFPITNPSHIIANIDTLHQLIQYHIHTIPFENLLIHRSMEYSLQVDHLYNKIVKRQQGGFCLEINGLFGTVLTSLGYDVSFIESSIYTGHATEEMNMPWTSWCHLGLIVKATADKIFPNKRWYVDIGLGLAPNAALDLDAPFATQSLTDGYYYRFICTRDILTAPIYTSDHPYIPVTNTDNTPGPEPIDPTADDYLILERYSTKKSAWIPRVLFHRHIQPRVFPEQFAVPLDKVLHTCSPFRQNVLVTFLPRPHVQWTIAGLKLIESVLPYGERKVTQLESADEAINVIIHKFGVQIDLDDMQKHPLVFGGVGYTPPPMMATSAPIATSTPAPTKRPSLNRASSCAAEARSPHPHRDSDGDIVSSPAPIASEQEPMSLIATS